MADNFNWTSKAVQALRTLWDEGCTTADIGRRLGCSKNAVAGKVHRLDLPERPLPAHIGAKRQAAPRVDRNAKKEALTESIRQMAGAGHSRRRIRKALGIKSKAIINTLGFAAPKESRGSNAPPWIRAKAKTAREKPRTVRLIRGLDALPSPRSCQYIFGEVGEEGWKFCGQETPVGSSWCVACRHIVFTVDPHREEAA